MTRATRRGGIIVHVVAGLAVCGLAAPAVADSEVVHQPVSEITRATVVLPGDAPGVVDAPYSIAATDDAVWVAHHRAGRVDRIDPRSDEVVASIDVPTPGCGPDGCWGLQSIVADRHNVWVFNDDQAELVHIDARTNRVLGSVPTTGATWSAPVINGNSVWAALSHSGAVMRVSARTHKVTKTVRVDATEAWPLAIVDDALWIGSYSRTAGGDPVQQLHRVDLRTGAVTRTVSGATGAAGRVVGDDLWLSGCWYLVIPDYVTACPSLRRIDGRTGAVEAEVPLGGIPSDPVRVDGDTLAIHLDTGVHTPAWITIVDTRQNAVVAAYDLPPAEFSAGIAFGAGSLWAADWTANTVTRTTVP